jgi:mono/diheme cytochrome c family protein
MKRVIILGVFVAVVLTAVYTIITVYDKNLKVGRMFETPAIFPQEQPLLIMEPDVVPFGGGEAEHRNTKAEDLKSPFKKDDPKVVSSGKTLYFTYCAQCHGIHQDGNGTVGQSFNPLPTDLQSERVQSMPQGVFFKEISYGVPDGRQPELATTIDIMDRWRIIAYVQSLGLRK